MHISLEGKRVFITAGAMGIGRATVVALHKIGAKVITCDVNEDAMRQLPEGIEHAYCDVSDSEQVNGLLQQVLAEGGLDILINNAGVSGPTKPVEEVTDTEWSQCMGVCINSHFYCARCVVPVFKQQKHGIIINLISGAGILGFPNRSPYAAAKWAVHGFTKTLAMELGSYNIRVNGIIPGSVNGDRMERVIKAHAEEENIPEDEIRRLYAIGSSMQCYVDPEEIADMICYLCSDYARNISGQIIGIDGHTESVYPRML